MIEIDHMQPAAKELHRRALTLFEDTKTHIADLDIILARARLERDEALAARLHVGMTELCFAAYSLANVLSCLDETHRAFERSFAAVDSPWRDPRL